MAKDLRRAIAERTERGRALLAARAYVRTEETVLVFAESAGVAGYEVVAGTCSCPDARVGYAAAHLGGRCKHVVCAELAAAADRNRARRRLDAIAAVFAG